MTDSEKRKVKPVAAGCVVSWNDLPIVIISFTCFAAFIIYGASCAALGAAVPALSRALNRSESRVGVIFIFRGAGFLTGTLGSAALMAQPSLPLSKEVITCLAAITMGIPTYLISCTDQYSLVLGLSVIQGLGFGGIDCISNCLFPELWGNRIQPWMQALHLCFGIGAMIGPALVGMCGYVTTYRILGVTGFLPLVALQIHRFFSTSSNDSLIHDSNNSSSSISNSNSISGEGSAHITKEDVSSFYKYVSTSITEDDDMDMDSTYSPFAGRNDKSLSSNDSGADSRLDIEAIRSSLDNKHDSNNTLNSTDTGDSSKSNQSDETEANPVTFTLRILILVFYFIYTGMEAGYAGWIPVYVLEEDITLNDSHAAYVAATFWATMTIGRMLAVFTAIAFSATAMLRFHLSFAAVCSVMFMFVQGVGTLQYALTVAALMGLALSAIYPLVMTIVIDYGYTMDSYSTTLFMVGATMGEAGMPMAIGFLLEAFGPGSMPWTILVCAGAQTLLYIFIHFLAAQGSFDEGKDRGLRGHSMEGEEYSKISLDTDDDTVDTGVEMTDL